MKQVLQVGEVSHHRRKAFQHHVGSLHRAERRPSLHQVCDQTKQGAVCAEPCEGRFGQGHGVHGIFGQHQPSFGCVEWGAFSDPAHLLEHAIIAPGLVRPGRKHAALLGQFRPVLQRHDHTVVPPGRAAGSGKALPCFSQASHGIRSYQRAGRVHGGPAGFWILNGRQQREAFSGGGACRMLPHVFDELGVQLLGFSGREEAAVVAAGGAC